MERATVAGQVPKGRKRASADEALQLLACGGDVRH